MLGTDDDNMRIVSTLLWFCVFLSFVIFREEKRTTGSFEAKIKDPRPFSRFFYEDAETMKKNVQ